MLPKAGFRGGFTLSRPRARKSMSSQRFTAGVEVAGRPRASAPSSGSGCLSEPPMDAAFSFLFLRSFCLCV